MEEKGNVIVSLLKTGCQVENHIVRKMSSEVFKNELGDCNTNTYLYGLIDAK